MENSIIDEYQIISNIIIDEDYQQYLEELDEKYFTIPLNKKLFNKALELYKKNQLSMENILFFF